MKKVITLACVITAMLTSCSNSPSFSGTVEEIVLGRRQSFSSNSCSCSSSETCEQDTTQTQSQTELPKKSSAVFRTFINNTKTESEVYIYLEDSKVFYLSGHSRSLCLFAEKGDTITYCGNTILDITFHE